MGFAIILIMLYHLGYAGIFNIGVDIFLLLSGMGVYYSQKKNTNTVAFYKKRLTRILPEFLIVSISVSLIYMFLDHKSITDTLIMASGLSMFFNHSYAFWFIPLILICYIVSPLFYRVLSKSCTIKLTIFIMSCFICYMLALVSGNAYILFSRIPVFLVGMLISPAIADSAKITNGQLYIMALISVIGVVLSQYLLNKGVEWLYVFISYSIYVLPLTLCLSFILSKIHWKFLPYLGTITLELYLLHESFCIRFANMVLHGLTGLPKMILCTIISIALAVILSKGLQYANNKIVRRLWH